MKFMFFVAKSNMIEVTSPHMDLYLVRRQVERVENKSLESTAKQKLI